MSNYVSVLSEAQQLSDQDRVRLIEALWDSVPPDSDAMFSSEWKHEIERRAAELDAGTAKTVSWSQIKNEAIARIGNAKAAHKPRIINSRQDIRSQRDNKFSWVGGLRIASDIGGGETELTRIIQIRAAHGNFDSASSLRPGWEDRKQTSQGKLSLNWLGRKA